MKGRDIMDDFDPIAAGEKAEREWYEWCRDKMDLDHWSPLRTELHHFYLRCLESVDRAEARIRALLLLPTILSTLSIIISLWRR